MIRNFIILTVILLCLALLDFSLGSIYIPFHEIIKFLTFQMSSQHEFYEILNQLRLSRVLSAMASGICLSLSGLLMQNYFRNPLAGPYVLGITSGAGLAVAIFIMASNVLYPSISTWFVFAGVSGSAIFGSLSFMIIIFLVSLRLQHSTSVLIAGILLGTAANAIISFLQHITSGLQLQAFIYWNMGSLYNADSITSIVILIISFISIVILLRFSHWLDLWLTGDEQAINFGVSKTSFTLLIFTITSVLIGLATAFYGPIAFVGLISPHIARMIFQTQLHFRLIIFSSFTGIYLMLIADILMQLMAHTNMPLNTIISLLSLPILSYLFIKKKELWM
ncbi:MAG: iron ABC transporter permease [Bacteroidales bacterium]|nr:iron ABC transporter permease [Bacteroidales bacterium]